MHEWINNNLSNAGQLEKYYQQDPVQFKKSFDFLYPDIQNTSFAQFWYARLNYEKKEFENDLRSDWILVIILSLTAGIIAKIPDFTSIPADFYYPRNLAFVVFPMLTLYFVRTQKLNIKSMVGIYMIFLGLACFINFLPNNIHSDTLILACIHHPILSWYLLGFTYTGFSFKNISKWILYFRFNSNLLVISSLLFVSGVLFSLVTLSLFSILQMHIEEFYFHNIAIWAIAAIPVVGTYVVSINPSLVNHISPIIAKGFAPLVLLMVISYSIAMFYNGCDLYNNREFLIHFNILLIGVMAIIFFSIVETTKKASGRVNKFILFLLSIITILVNCVALSAILFRISEWGITPNRLAVLGSNVLIFINLWFVCVLLYKSLYHGKSLTDVEYCIARYFRVYAIWAIIVVFIFPILFNYR